MGITVCLVCLATDHEGIVVPSVDAVVVTVAEQKDTDERAQHRFRCCAASPLPR
uniref:U650m n=1 Tax=Mycobacterium leprae TaxID=1769 RepID=Q50105_MYCLR|nr:u650m [Mycobacterium leprae]